jgi:hypothetical protein
MGQARDEAGNIWETDAQGNAVRLVQPAAGGRVVTLPPNPEKVAATERQAARDAAQDAERTADNARADRALSLQEEMAGLNAEVKRLAIEKARGGGGTAATRDRTSRLNQLVRQINRVQTLYDDNIGATDGVAGLRDYLPTNENARFDAAGAALSQQGLAAFRVPGTGTVSDRDAIMFDRANLPTASTRDAAIEEQLLGLRSRVEEEMRSLGLVPPEWDNGPQQRAEPEVDPVTGAARADLNTPDDPGELPPANMPGGNDPTPVTPASGGTRTINRPEVASMAYSMMRAGAGFATIKAALEAKGGTLTMAQYADAAKRLQTNPGANPFSATQEVPLSLMERASGSAPGAFAAQMANSATAGIPAYLAGAQGQGALDAMEAMHPDASLAGTLAGGVTGALGAEAALAARAPAALAKYAPRIADTLFGATSGFTGAEDGNRLEGAAAGALLAPLAGKAGELATRGVGATLRGVTDPAVQYLRQRGIPMTVGQSVGNSGPVGSAVKKIEDSLTSVPFVGNMVDARRMEGLEAFNRAAFQDAAPPSAQITATGGNGMGQIRNAVAEAYSAALDPVQIMADEPQFIDDLAATIQSAQRIPNVGGAQDAAMASLQSRIEGAVDPLTDTMTGRGFQEAYRGLARTGRERAAGDYGHEIGQTMRQGQDALGEVLERQNPGAFEGFLEANAANRRANVLAQALGNASNQADELITPAQLNRADVQSTSRLEGKINSASGNRPFYELATAGQSVLPSKLPDSGTWTRALTGLGVTGAFTGGGAALGGAEGAGTGTGLGLGTTLALLAGGTKGGQALMRELLLNRPDVLVQAGNALQRNARIGGGFGAGVLTPLVVGQ